MNMIKDPIKTIKIVEEYLSPILSPVSAALALSLFQGKEGLSEHTDCTIFETCMRWVDLADHFECEANSDQVPEEYKHQRDVSADDTRVKAMRNYLNERPDSIFPSITLFVNKMDLISSVDLANGDVVVNASLPANAERLICDGQGRLTTIKAELESHPKWKDYTVGVKVIVTNTESLFDCSDIIRQVFSDINGQTRKPDSSLSMYFDTKKPLSRLTKEVVECSVAVGGEDVRLQNLLALNGKIKQGQLWTLKQFSDSLPLLFATSASALNKQLADEELYERTKTLCIEFYSRVLAQLPLDTLQTDDLKSFKRLHSASMFTKALFAKALGYVGRSLFEEGMVLGDGAVDWSKLEGLVKLPIGTLNDEIWLKSQVSWLDESIKDPTVKIHKASDKKIARVICQHSRIFPTVDI